MPSCPHSLVVVCSASIESLCNGTAHKFSLNNFTRNLSSCISKQVPLSRPSSSHLSVLIYQLYGTQWHPCEGGYRMAQTSKLAQYVFWGRMIYLDDWIASSMAKPNVVYIQCCIEVCICLSHSVNVEDSCITMCNSIFSNLSLNAKFLFL